MSAYAAPNQFKTAAELKQLGAVVATLDPAVPGKFLNYEPASDQNTAGGGISLELSGEARRTIAVAEQRSKMDNKYDALKTLSPKGNAPVIQKRGMDHHNALLLRHTGRRPVRNMNQYAALKTPQLATRPAPKPVVAAPRPAIAVAPSMTMQVGQLQNDRKNRAHLRLVAAEGMPDAPKPSGRKLETGLDLIAGLALGQPSMAHNPARPASRPTHRTYRHAQPA